MDTVTLVTSLTVTTKPAVADLVKGWTRVSGLGFRRRSLYTTRRLRFRRLGGLSSRDLDA